MTGPNVEGVNINCFVQQNQDWRLGVVLKDIITGVRYGMDGLPART